MTAALATGLSAIMLIRSRFDFTNRPHSYILRVFVRFSAET
jgi:hypothetical protein